MRLKSALLKLKAYCLCHQNALSLAVLLMLQLFTIGFVLSQKEHPCVVSFDKARIHGHFIKQLALSKATEAQVVLASTRFKSLLEKTIQSYSREQKVIVVERQWVLAGDSDVTGEIAKKLSRAMRGQS